MQYPDLPDYALEPPDMDETPEIKRERKQNKKLDEYLNDLDYKKYMEARDV